MNYCYLQKTFTFVWLGYGKFASSALSITRIANLLDIYCSTNDGSNCAIEIRNQKEATRTASTNTAHRAWRSLWETTFARLTTPQLQLTPSLGWLGTIFTNKFPKKKLSSGNWTELVQFSQTHGKIYGSVTLAHWNPTHTHDELNAQHAFHRLYSLPPYILPNDG